MNKENQEDTNQISEEKKEKKLVYNELIINGYKYKYKITNKNGYCFDISIRGYVNKQY